MNTAIISGNLGKDVEAKITQNGTTVANFSLASTEYYKGEKQTTWHRVVAFGKTAELAGEYLSKGSKALIQGRIQHRSYEKDGQTRYITEIVADRVEFLDSKPTHSDVENSEVPF